MGSSRDLGLPPYPSPASGPGPNPLEPAERVVTLSSLPSGVRETSLLFAGNWGSSLWCYELDHALICEWVFNMCLWGLPVCSTFFAVGLEFSEMCKKLKTV